eukprot:scpid67757/ scgid30244/ 
MVQVTSIYGLAGKQRNRDYIKVNVVRLLRQRRAGQVYIWYSTYREKQYTISSKRMPAIQAVTVTDTGAPSLCYRKANHSHAHSVSTDYPYSGTKAAAHDLFDLVQTYIIGQWQAAPITP